MLDVTLVRRDSNVTVPGGLLKTDFHDICYPGTSGKGARTWDFYDYGQWNHMPNGMVYEWVDASQWFAKAEIFNVKRNGYRVDFSETRLINPTKLESYSFIFSNMDDAEFFEREGGRA